MTKEDWIRVVHDRPHQTSCRKNWQDCFKFQVEMGVNSHNEFYTSIAEAVMNKLEKEYRQ